MSAQLSLHQRARPRREFLALMGLTTTAAALTTTGCGRADARSGVPATTLRYQGWAGSVIPPELAEDLGYLGSVSLKWVGNTTSGPQDIQAAAAGDVDFGGAFNGAVVKMAAAKAPVKAVISYYGVNPRRYTGFLVREDSGVRTARDLIGKRVAMNTLGAHAEAVLDTYLKKHGLGRDEADRVERVALPPVNMEQALRKGHIDVVALDELFRAQAETRGGVRELFNDHDLLGTFSAGTYVMADRFLDAHPQVARDFVTGVARALEWARARPRDQVVARMVRIIERRGRNEDTAPLRYWKSFGVAREGGRIAEQELATWADWLAARGDIKADRVHIPEIYTNAYNRYDRYDHQGRDGHHDRNGRNGSGS